MSYLDTCVIIAYGFKEEQNHLTAEKLVKKAKTHGDFYASTFSLVELFCVISRKHQNYHLPSHIEILTDEETKVESIVLYLKLLNLKIPSDTPVVEDWEDTKIFQTFLEKTKIAYQTKLKGTNDTLHVAYVKKFYEKGLLKYLVTLDPDMNLKKDVIEKTANVSLLGIKPK